MNRYTIVLSKKAKRQLDKLSDHTAKPLFAAIASLEKNPRPVGCIKLKDRDGYRIRVGDYRIIYQVLDKELIIDVIDLGHRREIYD